MKVLVTGGAGYIGSCVAAALTEAGHQTVILDAMINGESRFVEDCPFYKGNIGDVDLIGRIRREKGPFDGVIHCAALTIVPESVTEPERYYRENVTHTALFFQALAELGCPRVILSGSASVYGDTPGPELTEKSPVNPGSPYARSKLIQEWLLSDFCNRSQPGEAGASVSAAASKQLRGIVLRYFNPVGADLKHRRGPYKPHGSHLIAKLMEPGDKFTITGTDYPTRDGTGLRDYFHILDLAAAHVRCLERFDAALEEAQSACTVINLGSGRGVTVREFVDAYRNVTDAQFEVRTAPPRPGDVAGGYAAIDKAKNLLDWQPQHTLEEAIASAIEWDRSRAT